MNNRFVSFALALSCAAIVCALPQEPPGCVTKTHMRKHLVAVSDQRSEISGKLPKRKLLDLRTKKKKRRHKAVPPVDNSDQMTPVIASPIYLPQSPAATGTAITASGGFLYVVVGQRLYKVSEKTLKTIQVSQLGHGQPVPAMASETPRRKRKIVASNDEEPAKPLKKRHRSSKTD
jgi:hypothetical protein